MSGLEQAGAEKRIEFLGVPIDAPEVQGALMLFAYTKAHEKDQNYSNPHFDLIHADQNEQKPETAAAMAEWSALGATESLSLAYRDYVSNHPHKRVNLSSEEELAELLTEIKTTSGTVSG